MLTSHPGAPPGRPKDYQLVLPDGWFRIDVRPGIRKRAIKTLLDRQFLGIENAAQLKDQTAARLMEMAKAAYQTGGIEIYICQQDVLGVPVPASLVVTLTPPAADGQAVTVEQLAEIFRADEDVSVIQLPAGPAVRSRRRTIPGEGDPSGNTSPVTNLEIHVPVPASGGSYLVLAFSTNMDTLADSLVALFDAIAGTLRWIQ